jgi:hypothetical protein
MLFAEELADALESVTALPSQGTTTAGPSTTRSGQTARRRGSRGRFAHARATRIPRAALSPREARHGGEPGGVAASRRAGLRGCRKESRQAHWTESTERSLSCATRILTRTPSSAPKPPEALASATGTRTGIASGARRVYLPRRPTETVLYRAVREHLETFLRHTRET